LRLTELRTWSELLKFLCALRTAPEATRFWTRDWDLVLPPSARSRERKLLSWPSGVFSLLLLERPDFLFEVRRVLSVNQISPLDISSNGDAISREDGESGL